MSNFTELDFLPKYDLLQELKLLEHKLDWGKLNQICINTLPDDPDNYHVGAGSLYLNWQKAKDGNVSWALKDNPPHESDFTEIASVFKNTLFEKLIDNLRQYYEIGRVRLMRSNPKTTLTWHKDDTIRLHYPLETYDGCFMVIGNDIKKLEVGKWYETNTLVNHTAFNGSTKRRLHLVVNVIRKKIPNNIIITGHTKGLGKLLHDYFLCDGISRSTGHDITDVDKIVETVKDYKTFINNANNGDLQYQICKKLWNVWKDDPNKKIINIGSRAKDFIKAEYGLNKNILSQFTKYANFNGKCRVSCINFGYTSKLTNEQIIKTMEFVLSTDLVLEEITAFGIDDD